jgi:hypothetical protein
MVLAKEEIITVGTTEDTIAITMGTEMTEADRTETTGTEMIVADPMAGTEMTIETMIEAVAISTRTSFLKRFMSSSLKR